MTASVNFTYGLQGKDSKIREHLEAIQSLISGVNAGTTAIDALSAVATTISGTLTNTDKLLTDTDGNVLTPNVPLFRVTDNGGTINIGATGMATNTSYDFANEIFDAAGNFSTDTFTAPTSGRYLFTLEFTLSNISGVNGGLFFGLSANGVGFARSGATPATPLGYTSVGIIELDASDTVVAGFGAAGANGDSLDISFLRFSGMLIG